MRRELSEKTKIRIAESETASGAYIIMIYNGRAHNKFPTAVEKIIRRFWNGEELFFGFFRTDGINLENDEFRRLSDEIPALFAENGEMRIINEYLTAARAGVKDEVCHAIPSIFDYYLGTTVFRPKVGWDEFMRYHSGCIRHCAEDIIPAHLADAALHCDDSGDFAIIFDPEVYDAEDIRKTAYELFGD